MTRGEESRGVVILLYNNFEYTLLNHGSDSNGNLLYVDINAGALTLHIINIFAPNVDTPYFFQNINTLIEENTMDRLVLCGDFNLVLNPDVDCSNYVSINNPKSRSVLIETINVYSLKDAFRHFHPNTRRYTWRRKNPIKQARLDYFIVSNAFTDLLSECRIIPGYRSDHSIVEMDIEISDFKRGKGLWKFNCNLLKNIDYLNIVNQIIQEIKVEYAVPVYNIDYLYSSSDFDLVFSIDEDLLLELLLFKIRSQTIKFATRLKKSENSLEKDLIDKINVLERDETVVNSTEQIDTFKTELQNLREKRMKGSFIRSRVQWLQLGEKPSQYFCSLEQKNYLDKTIRKIMLDNGDIITEQAQILATIKEYYAKLFQSKDSELENYQLSQVIDLSQICKLTNSQAQQLEGPITMTELGIALKV